MTTQSYFPVFRPASCLIVAMMAAFFSLLLGITVPAAQASDTAKKQLLIVTVTKGFRHADSIPLAEKIIADLGDRTGAWTVDYCRTDADMAQKMTAASLKHYDGIVFASTTGELPLPDRAAFLQWIRDGGAFIGMHAATDTFHQWPEYLDMIGAHFVRHGKQVWVIAHVQDPAFPATNRWGAGRLFFDEIYEFDHYDPNTVHHLVDMDRHPQTGAPGLFPIAWCKRYGKGRVFYTSLGHRPDVWKNAMYQQHITGGILWALGLVPGDATPQQRDWSTYGQPMTTAAAANTLESGTSPNGR